VDADVEDSDVDEVATGDVVVVVLAVAVSVTTRKNGFPSPSSVVS
jgi:hypothetical protein